ncbi:MAG: methylated-DNA--[protein]-cysteine S-methyltransferase [Myxococcales bacterium]|nr:methylated-DNA--[protein]-cysteine S-methyltransferase [Myxococcales bacterium]
MERVYETNFSSPLGELLLVASESALVGVFLPGHRWPPLRGSARAVGESEILAQATRELDEYFHGRRTRFTLPLATEGTPFQRRVWTALESIPYGETRSYRWLAETIGKAKAVRAVGAANGRNPISIVVPCHRVIGSDGSLTGYGGGLAAKSWLLDHESRFIARARSTAADEARV